MFGPGFEQTGAKLRRCLKMVFCGKRLGVKDLKPVLIVSEDVMCGGLKTLSTFLS